MYPSGHARSSVLNILFAEEIFRLHLIDGIYRTQEVALVTERHGGIDAHAAFEHGVRGGPLLVTGSHAFGRHERLPAPPGDRVENIGTRVNPCREAPHDVV